MTRLVPLSFLLILLAACALSQVPVIDSGVEGQVTIGPMCPVVRLDQPCPDQPYQVDLTILDQSGKYVAQIQTDISGLYRLVLPPEITSCIPKSPNGIPHAQDQALTVIEGQFTKLDIVYDSGIR